MYELGLLPLLRLSRLANSCVCMFVRKACEIHAIGWIGYGLLCVQIRLLTRSKRGAHHTHSHHTNIHPTARARARRRRRCRRRRRWRREGVANVMVIYQPIFMPPLHTHKQHIYTKARLQTPPADFSSASAHTISASCAPRRSVRSFAFACVYVCLHFVRRTHKGHRRNTFRGPHAARARARALNNF